MTAYDVIIVGAGPAGLNAAQVLGRARRRVLVLDASRPRNYATHEMHGVLGHDGLDPADLRERGRAELERYGVQLITAEAQAAERDGEFFRVTWPGGSARSRTLLLATGLLDEVPNLKGFEEVWGVSAHTCPYCDGWEHRDERLAVLAKGPRAAHLSALLRQWSDDVVLLTDGPHGLADEEAVLLDGLGVPIVETAVAELRSLDRQLQAVQLADGTHFKRDALFFHVGWEMRNDLAAHLGCTLREDGSIVVDDDLATDVDGVYAAGNCSEPTALVPIAAGAGVRAAVAINVRLTFDEAVRDRADARHPDAQGAVTIRGATAADAPFVLALVPSFVDFGLPGGREPEEVAQAFARDLQQALDGGAAVFIAQDAGGAPLGFVHLEEVSDLNGRPRAHVGDLAVATAAQGRGIGRRLMAFAESWARERGYQRIGLSAFTTNERAIGFYEQLGYSAQLLAMTKPLAGSR